MATFDTSLAGAQALDKADPLAYFRDRFYHPPNIIYLDGNSMGLCSKEAEQAVYKALADWKKYGIGMWTAPEANYFVYQDILGALTAPLINADPDEVTICTNTTINIHQGVATFYRPTPKRHKILVDDLNFPTDRYAITSQIKLRGYDPAKCLKTVPSPDGKLIDEDALIAAMTDDVALVFLPAALYRSAQLLDMVKITQAAHQRGILIGWDLCHSIGAVPHDFKAVQPDFAVWCSYKYLNGGPGAIAGLYINRRHFQREPGLAGWHGNNKATQFDLLLDFEPAQYAGGWQTGTQPVLSMAPLEGSLKLLQEAGMDRIRQKSLRLTAYLMCLIDEKLAKYGFTVGNPRDDKIRGGHVALEHDDAIRINAAIKAAGVVPDFRHPNVIRLAPVALYNTYTELYRLVEIIEKIMTTKAYEQYENKTGVVA